MHGGLGEVASVSHRLWKEQREAMKNALSLSNLFLVCLIIGCSTLRVETDWDPEVDFSTLESWRWAPVSHKAAGDFHYDSDTLFAKRVRRAVGRELAARGLRLAESGRADVQVAFYLVVEDRIDVTSINRYHGYGPGWGWSDRRDRSWGYGPGAFGPLAVWDPQYKQGTLVIDIASAADNQLIWRGSASARLADKVTPERSEERVNEAVQQILARFPPAKQ